jgi:hypothetical protein
MNQELRQILNDWRNNHIYTDCASYRELPSPIANGETYFHLSYKLKIIFLGISEDIVMIQSYHTQTLKQLSEHDNTNAGNKML